VDQLKADGLEPAGSKGFYQPVKFVSRGKFEDIVLGLAAKVADDPQRPEWKSDSFFRRFAAVGSAGQ
jgi:hypothetical protein